MKKIVEYFHLNKIGGLELLFAFFPILSQYNWGVVYLAIIVLLFMDIISIGQGHKPIKFKPLLIFVFFWVIHEIPIIIGFEGNIFGFLQNVLTVVSILFIVPCLRLDRLIGPFYLVGIISMAGLLYHFILLFTGSIADIHPLTLPFLPAFDANSRAMEDLLRPSSFFWEPSSYITFMLIPMFFSLLEKKYLFSTIILFFNLLSGSTNGIAFSFALLGFYVITQDIKIISKVLIVVVGLGMGYFLMTSELFTAGVEKLENTSTGNQRLHNGPALIDAMPIEHIVLGIPAWDVTEYYYKYPEITRSEIIPLDSGNIFISDIWRVLAKYGIIGVLLYINIYFWFIRKCKLTRPYSLTLCLAMFTQSVFLEPIFAYQMVVLLVLAKQELYTKSSIASHRHLALG